MKTFPRWKKRSQKGNGKGATGKLGRDRKKKPKRDPCPWVDEWKAGSSSRGVYGNFTVSYGSSVTKRRTCRRHVPLPPLGATIKSRLPAVNELSEQDVFLDSFVYFFFRCPTKKLTPGENVSRLRMRMVRLQLRFSFGAIIVPRLPLRLQSWKYVLVSSN